MSTTQRDDQAAVGIELNMNVWGAAVATETREHAMEDGFAAGNARCEAESRAQVLRLTGGGAAFFLAFSASFIAS